MEKGTYLPGEPKNGSSTVQDTCKDGEPRSISVYFNAQPLQQRPLHLPIHLHNPNPRLIQQHQLAFACEAEICDSAGDHDLAYQDPTGRPDVDPIAAAAVDIAARVAFDAVWDAVGGGGEEAAVGEERVGVPGAEVECVAGERDESVMSDRWCDGWA